MTEEILQREYIEHNLEDAKYRYFCTYQYFLSYKQCQGCFKEVGALNLIYCVSWPGWPTWGLCAECERQHSKRNKYGWMMKQSLLDMRMGSHLEEITKWENKLKELSPSPPPVLHNN
jgi:hypothetical protein